MIGGMMSPVERMARFLNDVQGIFMQYNWPYTLPKVTQGLNENDDPDDKLIDAHWQEPKFELLLSLEDGSFCYYADDYGEQKFGKPDASPQDVAETIRLLTS